MTPSGKMRTQLPLHYIYKHNQLTSKQVQQFFNFINVCIMQVYPPVHLANPFLYVVCIRYTKAIQTNFNEKEHIYQLIHTLKFIRSLTRLCEHENEINATRTFAAIHIGIRLPAAEWQLYRGSQNVASKRKGENIVLHHRPSVSSPYIRFSYEAIQTNCELIN